MSHRLYLFEQPGHALVITQWKPELALSGDPTLLNLTIPETIPTVKSIWKGVFMIVGAEYSFTEPRTRVSTVVAYKYVPQVAQLVSFMSSDSVGGQNKSPLGQTNTTQTSPTIITTL